MRKRKFDLRFNHVSLVYKKSNRNENLHKFKKIDHAAYRDFVFFLFWLIIRSKLLIQ